MSTNAPGYLIALEGIDGAGKSTQAARLERRIASNGRTVLRLHEPTRGPFGARLRALMSEGRDSCPPELEFELFLRDREQNVRENIRPALVRGAVVILDRYYISSMAYQGARGLDPVEIRRANEAIAPVPDLLIIFDLPVAVALDRIRRRAPDGPNLFEREDQLLRAKTILDGLDGFPRLVRVDAMLPEDELEGEIARALDDAASATSPQP